MCPAITPSHGCPGTPTHSGPTASKPAHLVPKQKRTLHIRAAATHCAPNQFTVPSEPEDVAQPGFRPDAPPSGQSRWGGSDVPAPAPGSRPSQLRQVGYPGPAPCARLRPQPSARCSRPRNCGCGSERVQGLLGLSELEG